MWRGKSRSGISSLGAEMLATDLSKEVPELGIPVYLFEGIYDYTCSYTLAKEYFDHLKAPIKGFYTFEHSAHSPLFEEPEKMGIILQEDVLAKIRVYHWLNFGACELQWIYVCDHFSHQAVYSPAPARNCSPAPPGHAVE